MTDLSRQKLPNFRSLLPFRARGRLLRGVCFAAMMGSALVLGAALTPFVPAALAEEEAEEDVVLATVNGKEIRFSDILLAEEEMGASLGQLPQQAQLQYMLSMLIDREILAEAAIKAGYEDNDQVKERIAYYRAKALRDIYWTDLLLKEVTEDSIRAYYDTTIAVAEPKEEIRARHILVPNEETALEVIAEVQGGRPFEEVAAEKSTGPSKTNGGDLGYFTEGMMVPAFEEAAFQLKAGEMSVPVKTKFGWHVIKVEDRRTQPTPSFEEVRGSIVQQMIEEKSQEIIAKLREDATIVLPQAEDGEDGARPVIAPE